MEEVCDVKVYLVGGAVRDHLLGMKPQERDFVVVGATEKIMLEKGFTKVGKDFPVFLHPSTHEEYALARTERKTGLGYHGFACYFDEKTTLEEDLKRRDLTINAIAQDEDGTLIDPYHGIEDLHHKWLRHVSDAFSQDPLRVLRVARFQAKFSDFTIHPSTYSLLKEMVQSDDFPTLRKERVYLELKKSLIYKNFWLFLETLRIIGGLYLVMDHVDIEICRYNMSCVVDYSLEHKFAALVLYQNIEAVRGLQKLPLKKIELFITQKYIFIENYAQKNDAQAFLLMMEKTDALRKRDAMRVVLETHDAIKGRNDMSMMQNVWQLMDAITFPEALNGADGATIQAYYKKVLHDIVHHAWN